MENEERKQESCRWYTISGHSSSRAHADFTQFGTCVKKHISNEIIDWFGFLKVSIDIIAIYRIWWDHLLVLFLEKCTGSCRLDIRGQPDSAGSAEPELKI